jgi:Ser/Thr protein kinase RdoA (MazF antagonist)
VNENVLKHAAKCYGVATSHLRPLPGGHFADVYEFSQGGAAYVLRITPPNDEIDIQAMRAILEWMNFLATHGTPVSRPVRSRNNQLIELVEQDRNDHIVVVFEKAGGVLAEELPIEQWSDELFQSLGRTVGQMHRLAKAYVPPDRAPKRPEWDRADNCFNPADRLDGSQATIREKRERVLSYIRTLPRDEDCYGLIHADLHFGNLFADVAHNKVTILDFDDCAYGWYVMDVAMSVFDLVVLYPGVDTQDFATRFMKSYLKGYTTENNLSAFWISQLPHFLKLLEIGVYTQVYQFYDPNDADPWVGKFMAGRKDRIERGVPYMELEFESLSLSWRV